MLFDGLFALRENYIFDRLKFSERIKASLGVLLYEIGTELCLGTGKTSLVLVLYINSTWVIICTYIVL